MEHLNIKDTALNLLLCSHFMKKKQKD